MRLHEADGRGARDESSHRGVGAHDLHLAVDYVGVKAPDAGEQLRDSAHAIGRGEHLNLDRRTDGSAGVANLSVEEGCDQICAPRALSTST